MPKNDSLNLSARIVSSTPVSHAMFSQSKQSTEKNKFKFVASRKSTNDIKKDGDSCVDSPFTKTEIDNIFTSNGSDDEWLANFNCTQLSSSKPIESVFLKYGSPKSSNLDESLNKNQDHFAFNNNSTFSMGTKPNNIPLASRSRKSRTNQLKRTTNSIGKFKYNTPRMAREAESNPVPEIVHQGPNKKNTSFAFGANAKNVNPFPNESNVKMENFPTITLHDDDDEDDFLAKALDDSGYCHSSSYLSEANLR